MEEAFKYLSASRLGKYDDDAISITLVAGRSKICW